MIQVYYIYCALHFHYYYKSSTSDHQALDLRLGTPALEDPLRECAGGSPGTVPIGKLSWECPGPRWPQAEVP